MNILKFVSLCTLGISACVNSHALSCNLELDFSDHINLADSIFTGDVIDVETYFHNPNDIYSYYQIITFDKYLNFKGSDEKRVRLFLKRHLFIGDEIGEFNTGDPWIVFSRKRLTYNEASEIEEEITFCTPTGKLGDYPSSVWSMIDRGYNPEQVVVPIEGYPADLVSVSSKALYNAMLLVVYSEFYPWILHYNLGWIYIYKGKNGLRGYQEDFGYFYTDQQVFPYFYLYNRGEWIWYYDIRSFNKKLWIYKLSTLEWMSYATKRDWQYFW